MLEHVGQEGIDGMHELRTDLEQVEACEVSFKSKVGCSPYASVSLCISYSHKCTSCRRLIYLPTSMWLHTNRVTKDWYLLG